MTSNRPMNGLLYRRLCHRFGTVKIANAGEARIAKMCRDLFTGQRKDAVQQHGETYYVRCPFCRDSDLSLSINHMYAQLGMTGSQMLYLAYCKRSGCLANRENRDSLANRLSACDGMLSMARIVAGVERKTAEQPVELPEGMRPIDRLRDTHPVREFLSDYDLDVERLAKFYELGYCGSSAPSLARNRIIIPIRKKGELCGWQALSIAEDERRKYLSARGMATSKVVYNLERAREYPTVVIVPEALDVWRFGPMAVSLMGTCSADQLRMLKSACRGRIVVLVTLPDVTLPMAKRMAERFREELRGEFAAVRINVPKRWKRATRSNLRSLVREAAAKQDVQVEYTKVRDANHA